MKKIVLGILMLVMVMGTISCGSSGGGGGLSPARVEVLYQLTFEGTPMDEYLPLFLQNLAANCPDGSVPGNIPVTIGPTTCETSGTWSYSATVSCHKTVVGTVTNLTIVSVQNSQMELNACASMVSADVNGDGADENVNIVLTEVVTPLAMTNTTVVADLADPNNPVVNMNGRADIGYTDAALSGDVTATVTFNQGIIFTNFNPVDPPGPPACENNTVNAAEGGQSGTCTIQTNCSDCT